MEQPYLTMLGTIAGACIGAFAGIYGTRINRDWDKVKADVARLSEQVMAYHTLEAAYMEEIVRLDPNRGAARTVQAEMRNLVRDAGSTRPEMTKAEAEKIGKRWR